MIAALRPRPPRLSPLAWVALLMLAELLAMAVVAYPAMGLGW